MSFPVPLTASPTRSAQQEPARTDAVGWRRPLLRSVEIATILVLVHAKVSLNREVMTILSLLDTACSHE